jgi:AcrR family transcriptional regulator
MTDFRQLVDAHRTRRRKHGQPPLTVQQIATAAGVARSYMYALFRGRKTASLWVAENLADALGVALKDVLAALAKSRAK